MVQMAAITVVGMGVVFVLLLGEIDLSIGYVSAVAGVLVALLLLPGESDLPVWLVIILGLGSGQVIGALQGPIITKVGIPSFVVTLAGLLAWNGVVLLHDRLARHGRHPGPDDHRRRQRVPRPGDRVDPARGWASCSYAGIVLIGGCSAPRPTSRPSRLALVVLRVGGLVLVGPYVVFVANDDRGIPFVFVADRVPLRAVDLRARRTSSACTSTRSAATSRPPGAPASTPTSCGSRAS